MEIPAVLHFLSIYFVDSHLSLLFVVAELALLVCTTIIAKDKILRFLLKLHVLGVRHMSVAILKVYISDQRQQKNSYG